MRDYEAEDPVGYWENSASSYYSDYQDYKKKIAKVNEQISYARTVRTDIKDLLNDDSTVDDNLRALGNALDSALNDTGAAKSVMRLNSYDTDYINNAASKCTSLIEALQEEREGLASARDAAYSSYEYSKGRAQDYRDAGYE